ncbi:hypothetical protein AB0J80_02970 [Actinoplanes sp. NPDC049548]|uniref:hypothetical protein n=1 Tax=Actinoplanes sp. NPDC049548 TaxID=3155152 RepID=UPI003440A938
MIKAAEASLYELRHAQVSGNSAAACVCEVVVSVEESRSKETVSLADLEEQLRWRTKKVLGIARCTGPGGELHREVRVELDRQGLAMSMSAADTNWIWIDSTAADLERKAGRYQRRWIPSRTWLLRTFACVMGMIDSALVGLLVALAVGPDIGPKAATGVLAFVVATAVSVGLALFLPAFEIVPEGQPARLSHLLRVLVIVLGGGVALEVLINLAT